MPVIDLMLGLIAIGITLAAMFVAGAFFVTFYLAATAACLLTGWFPILMCATDVNYDIGHGFIGMWAYYSLIVYSATSAGIIGLMIVRPDPDGLPPAWKFLAGFYTAKEQAQEAFAEWPKESRAKPDEQYSAWSKRASAEDAAASNDTSAEESPTTFWEKWKRSRTEDAERHFHTHHYTPPPKRPHATSAEKPEAAPSTPHYMKTPKQSDPSTTYGKRMRSRVNKNAEARMATRRAAAEKETADHLESLRKRAEEAEALYRSEAELNAAREWAKKHD